MAECLMVFSLYRWFYFRCKSCARKCDHFRNETNKAVMLVPLVSVSEFVVNHVMYVKAHVCPPNEPFSRNWHIIKSMHWHPFGFNWFNIFKHISPRDIEWCTTLLEHLLNSQSHPLLKSSSHLQLRSQFVTTCNLVCEHKRFLFHIQDMYLYKS